LFANLDVGDTHELALAASSSPTLLSTHYRHDRVRARGNSGQFEAAVFVLSSATAPGTASEVEPTSRDQAVAGNNRHDRDRSAFTDKRTYNPASHGHRPGWEHHEVDRRNFGSACQYDAGGESGIGRPWIVGVHIDLFGRFCFSQESSSEGSTRTTTIAASSTAAAAPN
jgi:hypothetical protein